MERVLGVAVAIWMAFVLFVFTWTVNAGGYGDAVGWLFFASFPAFLWLGRVLP